MRCASASCRPTASRVPVRPARETSSFSTAPRPDATGSAAPPCSRARSFGEDDADKRPTVQVGDPFLGKKLIEVSVELVEAGLVESLQDCGAAGLASSLSEMARDTGIDLQLDSVPLREEGMEPWEVMISESQERMVAVVRPQMLDAVLAVCERWELHHAVVGEVTDTGLPARLWDAEVVGEVPAQLLHRRVPALRRRADAARRAKWLGATKSARRSRAPAGSARAALVSESAQP